MRKFIHPFVMALKYLDGVFYSVFVLKNIRIFINNHITVGLRYLKEQQVKLPHPIGVVIGQKVVLGKNCMIYQNVTIGAKDASNYKTADYPVLEDNVIVYPNSIILGKVRIGAGAIIGAGSLVLKDVEPNSIVAGVPAKKMK